ncbi:P-loop containing nucleoside triphosphate hydrolase protein [Aulographum hederae CBS 113979]|uniref:RNA helicase n=1 Tax=Aulographum hederae CBS 113979 TaxID=1176131 RepID=A0A6G1GXT5_9PEZI|nr:P-loop containing nucleoside triphosphate hydrolase protein [Aulographum hederae CBS 113979]
MPKKKKASGNPARGFATASIASKPKPEKKDDPTLETEALPKNEGPSDATDPTKTKESGDSNKDTKELSSLTPEELEAQLEQNELQNIVDSTGSKIHRDAARHITRVQTDCRILRAQASPLPTRDWLPSELMVEVLELAKKESLVSTPDRSLSTLREDDLLLKLWSLRQALLKLEVSSDQVKKLLEQLLKNPPPNESSSQLWGFREALDMLTMDLEESQLPRFDLPSKKAIADAYDSTIDAVPSPSSKLLKASSSTAPSRSGTETPGASTVPSLDSDPGESEIDVSDLDSDLEPDELQSVYLSTKSRIYHLDPAFEVNLKTKGKGFRKDGAKGANTPSSASPSVRKLLEKLQKIESDILFDKREADMLWMSKRNELAQEEAARRRLNLNAPQERNRSVDARPSSANATTDIMAEASAMAGDLQIGPDDDELIGSMFSEVGLQDAEASRNVETPQDPSTPITIRDFGKTTGLSPRRVLEEACRARDSGVKLTYKHVSATTYSSRHSVTIHWTSDQIPLEVDSMPSMSTREFSRTTIFTMVSVSAPDLSQSEAYVATAALFSIFSPSPREEKVYLRLPAVWRELWGEFASFRKDVVDAADRQVLKELRAMIQTQRERDEDEGVIIGSAFKNRNRAGVSQDKSDQKSSDFRLRFNPDQLQDIWRTKASTSAYQNMLPSRLNLPIFQFRDTALSIIDKHQITILCGETGCGKSTQLPAYILEHELSRGKPCKIYCTEPRRISAISLAQRVSEELGESRGDLGTARSLIGYAIRLESQTAPQTRLVYATVGIVLRMLESAKGLDDISHLIIDEVHERSIDTDFLLIILRPLLDRRPDLKVILMSATVDAQRFSKYLNDAPIITVPGRTFPVQTKYLEDAIELTHYTSDNQQKTDDTDSAEEEDLSGAKTSGIPKQLKGYSALTRNALKEYDEYRIDFELIFRLIEQIATDPTYEFYSKALLVFLPGIAEIRELNDMLSGHPFFSRNWVIYPLHSTIASEDQQQAFVVPPPGVRKIVIATNIAETGITIPDVTCVIDTGKHKEMRFDERRQLSRLIQSFISKANAKQRRGRAGRVQEGLCFHLFTKYRHDELMAEQQTPEMLRLSLQDLVMRVKICKLGDIEATLSEALDPPSAKNIRKAIEALIEVGALTSSEDLTSLGQQLAKLPLDANLGKLCLLSCIFSCLDVCLTLAALLSSKSPFVTPFGARQRADTVRLGFKKGDSDLLTAYNAYTAWRRVCQSGQSEFQFCHKNFLSPQNLGNIEDLKSQLLSSLVEAGFVQLSPDAKVVLRAYRYTSRRRTFVPQPASFNRNSENDLLVNSVVATAFYPKLLVREGKGWRNVTNSQAVSLHPTSVNKGTSTANFLSYYSILQSSNRFYNAHSTSMAYEIPLVLLIGEAEFKMHCGVCVVDGNRLRFKTNEWKQMLALKLLRVRVEGVVEKGLKRPGRALEPRERMWMDLFWRVFEKGDQEGAAGRK